VVEYIIECFNFYSIKRNGEKEVREWLFFSETSKSIYCFVCKLFCKFSNNIIAGYNDWKNDFKALMVYERSKEHIGAMCTYKKI
jgi:hypothetical protein